jgi:hypothetical protein
MTMISRPAELTPTVLNKAVGRYYKELQDYAGQAVNPNIILVNLQ